MTKERKKQLYEGMYIINPSLSEAATEKALSKIVSGIEEHGGEMKKVHDQGIKKLAYQIRGHRQGHYYLTYFEVFPDAIKELWHAYHLNEDLLRFMTLATEEVVEELSFKPLQVAE